MMLPRLKIVICDDDPDEILFLQFALQRLRSDYELVGLSSGLEMLDYLITATVLPDIIFLDNHMPGLSGIETLYCIKRLNLPTSILVFLNSICAALQDVDEAYGAGADRYIIKSVAAPQLENIVKRVLEMDKNDFLERDRNTFCLGTISPRTDLHT